MVLCVSGPLFASPPRPFSSDTVAVMLVAASVSASSSVHLSLSHPMYAPLSVNVKVQQEQPSHRRDSAAWCSSAFLFVDSPLDASPCACWPVPCSDDDSSLPSSPRQ